MRLTQEQEARGAQMYGDGATERDVAEALSCSPSTAHRLRERLDGGGQDGQDGGPAEPCGPKDGQDDGVLPDGAADPGGPQDGGQDAQELTRRRDELAARVTALEARAEQARGLVAGIEQERREALARGDDSATFAGRRREALEQAEDAAESARVLAGEVARIEQQLAEAADRRELARQRAELAVAVAERDVVYAASGDRQRAAVLAVAGAAAQWVAVFADESRTAGRVEQLAAAVAERALRLAAPLPDVAPPASTALTVSQHESQAGGGGLALEQAAYAARSRGTAAAPQVAELLGRANGWLPAASQPGPRAAGQAGHSLA